MIIILHLNFLGTSNGVSAVNVVAGGGGVVGPYAGGWQHNAMKNRLKMCLPDTLHVSPENQVIVLKKLIIIYKEPMQFNIFKN